jgi:hypothetical protein
LPSTLAAVSGLIRVFGIPGCCTYHCTKARSRFQ